MNKAVFLDRDGTLNYERDHLYKWENFEWLPGVIEGLKKLKEHGYLLIVVTNQAGIAKGLYTEHDVKKLHVKIDRDLFKRMGFKIDGWYYCPHHPEGIIDKFKINCGCRKPNPGLMKRAIEDFKLNIKECWMVGDRLSDIETVSKWELRSIMLLTGYGEREIKNLSCLELQNLHVAKDFTQATNIIIKD